MTALEQALEEGLQEVAAEVQRKTCQNGGRHRWTPLIHIRITNGVEREYFCLDCPEHKKVKVMNPKERIA